jgi:hypothetical protein
MERCTSKSLRIGNLRTNEMLLQCSENCGGEQTRQVSCFVNGTAGDPSKCESSALSQSSQSCEMTDECMKGNQLK